MTIYNLATARNTDKSKRGKWEVINYRTGKRYDLSNAEVESHQGQMSRSEAMHIAESINRRMSSLELGK